MFVFLLFLSFSEKYHKERMFKSTILFIILLFPFFCIAQRMQVIKGKIVDKETKTPLIGCTVGISDIKPPLGTVTDSNGEYIIYNVPVGKHTVIITYLGYETRTLPDVLITTAREVILPVELEENINTIKEVTITSKREHINEMAMVSVKTFDVQETERYAGSRSDPARMASNFAGAQGGDDSRNDIVIRGNSPQGVLWRMEGIDIPNPNHFSIPGTTGGPVSMLNNKTLSNSDFFTGAFPSEYGNSIAGVFDLKLRNGNNDRYEFTGQLGLLGTEMAAEGPISQKSGSSFLVNYRYSTLQIFQGMNIKIGTTSIPNYQDASFKFNFPLGKNANLSFFGLGGLSSINLIVSTLTTPTTQLYGESDRDQYFKSNTGLIGANYNYTINKNTYTQFTLAVSDNDIWAHHDKVFRNASFVVDSPLKPILGYDFNTATAVMHWYLNKKLSAKQILKFGIVNNLYTVNYIDSSRQYPTSRMDWQQRENYLGNTDLIQAYIQYKYRPSDKFTINAGFHAQYLTHNQSKSLEPRLGIKYNINHTNIITAGYGLHSQMQPLYQYFAHLPENQPSIMQNYNIDFTRSHHFVLGYDKALSSKLHLKLETYYQYLFNVPIETRIGSSYSALDQGSSYSRDFPDTLKNKGTGYNYGLELTLEKGFSHGFYILFTGSLFDSKAKGNDGNYYNTDYNSNYAFNILGGYEKKLGEYKTLTIGGKMTWIGGKLYSPVDTQASKTLGDIVVIDKERNTLRFAPYFRTDLKIGMRFNSKKVTHEIAIDLVNIFNTKNILSLTYSSDLASQGAAYPFFTQYQLGFLPIFYYRIDFGTKATPKVKK